MRAKIRWTIGVLLIATFSTSALEVNVLAKKKPKRRRSRTAAEKSAPGRPVLLLVTQRVPTTTSRGTPAATTPQTELKGEPKTEIITSPPAPNATATAGQLIISEFRLSGPGLPGNAASAPEDEFIEIYNASGADHTVQALSGAGYAIAASDGVTRCIIPNGQLIPDKSHFLCANSDGYSLTGYPESNPLAQNVSHATDIPDNAGIALFNNSTGGASFSIANRLDAVGSVNEANALYREGTGYPALTVFNLEHSFVRDTCGKGGNTSNLSACSLNGLPKDTDNNAADFFFIDTNGTNAGAGQRLGSPGPEALFGPRQNNSSINMDLLDTCAPKDSAPNRARNMTADAANNSTFGTLLIRRTVTNTSGVAISRLRFRIVDMTTSPSTSGIADLRFRSSSDEVVTVDRPPCGSGTSNVTVFATTLEGRFLFMGPTFQAEGGGMNALIAAGTITLFNSLAPGASVDLQFLLGVEQTGTYRFYVNVETS